MNVDLLNQASAIQDELVQCRRWLHTHPGVGFDLAETKEYVKARLTELGLSPSDCGKCGLIADIAGKPGKTILLRADMDALPIREEADIPFPSENGMMHACGHDLHTTMLLGAAKLLIEHRSELCGTVRLMFQSAEEIFEGAKDMIANGALEGVDAAVMIHVTAAMAMPAGTVIVSAPGVTAPAADYFTVRVKGKGCHGSTPHMGVDALTAAAHILIGLQELHARELPCDSGVVLTVGKMEGGTAGNAIADSAMLMGTIRTFDEKTRTLLKTRMADISRGIAAAFRAEAAVEFGSGCPTLCNDASLCQSVHQYLTSLLGPEKAISAAAFASSGFPSGGSEDFAYVSQQVPSVMLAMAAGEPDKGYTHPLHHPKTKLDESILSAGAAVFAHTAISYLAEL